MKISKLSLRRMGRMKLAGLAGAGMLAGALILAACGKKGPESNDILIGEFGALTGSIASFGQSTHKGVALAVEEVNAGGGVLGRKIRLITEDDQGKPEEALTAVTKLISKDRVSALIGEFASSNSLAAAPFAQQSRIPMVSHGSTNPKVTQIGDYIFRVCFIDPFQGEVMAKFARNTLKLDRVAILRDIKSDYSVGLADYFTKSFTALGGTVVADESYSAGDKDFNAQLTALKGKTPAAIFVPGYYTEVGLIARQARKLGVHAILLGGDGWDSDKLWEIGGEALNGSYFSNHYSVDNPSPVIQGFVEQFKARYDGEKPDALAALGYDAAKVLIDAIRRAGSDDPKAIRDSLATTQGFAGITGIISLNENRDAVKSAVVLEVKDGKFVYKETVDP
ncbi:MAG: branched-chain amino acid transporter, amino acid-binding protein [Fibrobacteria bacterium]|nr:branched-chain amino acid transporter, amino acid-binding protein [Fibrobacteria bacterium]